MHNAVDITLGIMSVLACLLRAGTIPTNEAGRREEEVWMDKSSNICRSEDAALSQFKHCPASFIGKSILQGNGSTEIKCPKLSVVVIISIHPSERKIIFNKECKTRCPSIVFREGCQANNSSCSLKGSDVWEVPGCHALRAEILSVCFKASRVDGQNLSKRSRTALCTKHLEVVQNAPRDGDSTQLFLLSQNLSSKEPEGSMKNNFRRNKVESLFVKREIKNFSRAGWNLLNDTSTDVTEVSGKYDITTSYYTLESNSIQRSNSSLLKETFLGRQISLWFSSINEPHLIRVFIKSNLEKFVLYILVFVCVGVMSVMAVVIYSLAYQIKRRRTYVLNKNNQQKPGKIAYHSPNNWRTPDSGSSTGDDRTLHEEEANAMDRTDSRHAMCSSMTETRSAREEPQLSPHQPLNNSVRGSTTLPSPPNSLIFERASPVAPNDGGESPRENPNTPSHVDIHFTDRISS